MLEKNLFTSNVYFNSQQKKFKYVKVTVNVKKREKWRNVRRNVKIWRKSVNDVRTTAAAYKIVPRLTMIIDLTTNLSHVFLLYAAHISC
jgi:hypothetical protein